MADESYDTRNVSRRSPGTVCYVAALDTTLRTPSPEPFIEEPDDENDYDPAFSLLLKQSMSVKEVFQFRSLDYGQLKYEMRRVVAYYNHGRHHRPMDTTYMLAINEVLDLSPDILRYACTKLSIEENRQKQFFTSWVKRVRTTFKQLELLLEDNNSLLDKLGVLHYPVEETKHIARRDRLFQSHTNLDFLMKDLCDEISTSLSSRLVANFSK